MAKRSHTCLKLSVNDVAPHEQFANSEQVAYPKSFPNRYRLKYIFWVPLKTNFPIVKLDLNRQERGRFQRNKCAAHFAQLTPRE